MSFLSPVRAARCSPVATFQSLTTPSWPPDANVLLSWLKASAKTSLPRPFQRTSFLEEKLQKTISEPSREASMSPSGLMATSPRERNGSSNESVSSPVVSQRVQWDEPSFPHPNPRMAFPSGVKLNHPMGSPELHFKVARCWPVWGSHSLMSRA